MKPFTLLVTALLLGALSSCNRDGDAPKAPVGNGPFKLEKADENEVVLLAPGTEPQRVERSSKLVVAGRILDRVAELLLTPTARSGPRAPSSP